MKPFRVTVPRSVVVSVGKRMPFYVDGTDSIDNLAGSAVVKRTEPGAVWFDVELASRAKPSHVDAAKLLADGHLVAEGMVISGKLAAILVGTAAMEAQNARHIVETFPEVVAASLTADPPGAAAERILAESRRAGWRPATGEYLACGSCTPCRNGSRSQCTQPNSARAQANAAERARMAAAHEQAELLAGRGWAPRGASVDIVESVQEHIAAGSKAAAWRERYG